MTPVIFINCTVEPYVDDIMGGLKQYETRSRNTLGRFLGERVLLAETGHGRPLVKCSAVIAEIISVHTREAWEEYLEQTWVPVGSEHDWKPNTKVKWLYRLSDVKPVVPFRLGSDCRRHGRVWAELPDLYCVSYENTGGSVMCYSALYDGRYWIFGATDGTMDAYTVDPLNTFDDDGYRIDENAYVDYDADEFPTWRDVLESIRESGQGDLYGMDWVEQDILHWQGNLDRPVNLYTWEEGSV